MVVLEEMVEWLSDVGHLLLACCWDWTWHFSGSGLWNNSHPLADPWVAWFWTRSGPDHTRTASGWPLRDGYPGQQPGWVEVVEPHLKVWDPHGMNWIVVGTCWSAWHFHHHHWCTDDCSTGSEQGPSSPWSGYPHAPLLKSGGEGGDGSSCWNHVWIGPTCDPAVAAASCSPLGCNFLAMWLLPGWMVVGQSLQSLMRKMTMGVSGSSCTLSTHHESESL